MAAYEFSFAPVLLLFKEALARGVDVRIVYDGREDTENKKPGRKNRDAVDFAGLAGVSRGRTRPLSTISHNKFIVHLAGGVPRSVWTGGTNFSRSGIFGHSNVAHVVRDAAVARKFFDYWTVLDQDPTGTALRASVEAICALPTLPPPDGTTQLFSPRQSAAGLDWIADLALGAKDGLFMTFAFGMNDKIKAVYRTSTAGLRFALMETKTRPMKRGSPELAAELEAIQTLRNMPENVFAVGALIATNAIDGWLRERLAGLTRNVDYIHNKFMLVDPLGSDPIVLCGSANFSLASVEDNEENMLVIRGNERVADIYLGEYMRLWSHHAFRESLAWRDDADGAPKFLKIDDWWRDCFGATERSARRVYFAPK